MLTETPNGLYCEPGGFYVDPWKPVKRAVVTHAHADHARPGCQQYLAAKAGEPIFRMRLGNNAEFQFVEYSDPVTINGVTVSLHPAGHMTGSAQVRLEYGGQVVVVSGDYKLDPDPTCQPYEPIRCHTFVTESTFGLPIYQWRPSAEVFVDINSWWTTNQRRGACSVLFGYTVGKAQRLLAGIDCRIGPIFAHGAVLNACQAYRRCGVVLPQLRNVMRVDRKHDFSASLVVAPPSARGSTWLRRFGNVSMAMASGWMQVRGIRRRRVVDRGFVLSDHVDWPGLLTAIKTTECESVWVTHGYTRQLTQYLRHNGYDARTVQTQFRGELELEETTEGERDDDPIFFSGDDPKSSPPDTAEGGLAKE